MSNTQRNLWPVTVAGFASLAVLGGFIFSHGCKPQPEIPLEPQPTLQLALCVKPQTEKPPSIEIEIRSNGRGERYTLHPAEDGLWCSRIREPFIGSSGFEFLSVWSQAALDQVQARENDGHQIKYVPLIRSPANKHVFMCHYARDNALRIPTVVGTSFISSTPLFTGDSLKTPPRN